MRTLPEQHVVEVQDGITAIVHEQGEAGVANCAFIVDSGDAFVVDTLLFPEMAQVALDAISAHGARARTVLNTHHHIDHVGGNAAFSGARILADPVTVSGVERVVQEEPPFERLLPPYGARVVTREVQIPEAYGERGVDDIPQDGQLLAFGPAHSPKDLAVWIPGSRTLLSGDLCSTGVVPLALHGDLGGWIEALDALIAMQPVVVVPGHGGVGTIEDLRVIRRYMDAVQTVARRAVADGATLEDALAALDPGPVGDWHAPMRNRLNVEAAMAAAAGVALKRPW